MSRRRPAAVSGASAPPRGEFAWIARLAEILGEPARSAIGDDAAIVEGQDSPWAWTTDTLVEDVHFRFDWLDPEAVGRRALVASLSDLAAAGARPAGALVAVAGPAATVTRRIEGLYAGLRDAGRGAECPILGGDLSRAEGPLHVTVTALGPVVGGPPLSRGGARAGDEIGLTGALGAPAAALALLAAASPEALPDVRAHPAYERLAAPAARNGEIAWLRERVGIHAAIDLSDGLSGDALHLTERSGVAIVLEPGRIPIHPGAVEAARTLGTATLEWALHGGEEFELLVAAPPGALEEHAARFQARFGIALTVIGAVRAGDGVWTRSEGGERRLVPRSWDHFAADSP